MEKKLKSWQGWLLFGGSMVVVFVLGLCVSALMERRAEVASIFNNRKNVIKGIKARNELFKNDFPREYQTWTETAKTDFESEFNGNIAVDELQKLPGVGRKTANVIASVVFNKEAMAVDTHVFRVSNRIGLTDNSKTPLETERTLVKHIPGHLLPIAHHWLILHGRYICTARKPKCLECGIREYCKYYSKKPE